MPEIAKRAFNRGELDPISHARSDWVSWPIGLAKARNVFVHKLGGVSNRAGTTCRAPVRYHDKDTRLIPFKFGGEDTQLLEFGDQYIRFYRNNQPVYDVVADIHAVSTTNPCVITTTAAHGFLDGEEVDLSGVTGVPELENRRCVVRFLTATTFALIDQLTDADIDGSAFGTYSSGGQARRVYTLASPYLEADLRFIKYFQSFDVLRLTCKGYSIRELRRAAVNSWLLVQPTFGSDVASPTSPSVTASSSGSTAYYYKVTAVNRETGEESLPALLASGVNITAATKANPCVITVGSAQNWLTGFEIAVTGVGGMTELNNRRFQVVRLTSTTFQLQGVNSTNYGTYTSGGTATGAQASVTGADITAGSHTNTVSWSSVAGPVDYSVYRYRNGQFGFIATTQDTSYVDNNSVLPNATETPPFFRDPFFGTGNEPFAVGRYQQRTVYGGGTNSPAKLEFSAIGQSNNLNTSNPIRADSAFSVTLDVSEYNEVRHVITGRDLMVFTNTATVIIDSSADSGFGFGSFRQRPQAAVGSSHLTPLVVDKWVLFSEELGNTVRSIQYRFSIDGYDPEDVSFAANHFFENDWIVDWARVAWPEPIVYAVTKDGYCLAFTYAPQDDLQVKAWTRFETDGQYKSVAALREFADDRRDAVAFIVKRGSNQFIEVQDDRNFLEVEDCHFLDNGAEIQDAKAISSIAGSTYTVTAHGWSNGDSILMPDGKYYPLASATTDTFELTGSDPSLYATGGILRRRQRNLSGLHQLAGKTVVALLDGNVERGLTVDANGLCTLPYSAGRIHIGLPYVATVHSLPVGNANIEYGGKMKKMSLVKIDVQNSRGFHMGVVGGQMSPWKQREFERIGQATQLFTGFTEKVIDSTWDREGKLAIEQRDPLPLTIRAFVPNYVVG
jgi:hypothetical protein